LVETQACRNPRIEIVIKERQRKKKGVGKKGRTAGSSPLREGNVLFDRLYSGSTQEAESAKGGEAMNKNGTKRMWTTAKDSGSA